MRRILIGCVVTRVVFSGIAVAQTGLHTALLQDGDRIAAEGDPAPGRGIHTSFSNLQVGSDGDDVAFRATLGSGAPASNGVFLIQSAVHTAVALNGATAPNNSPASPAINDAGSIAYFSTSGEALFLASGTTGPVVRNGEATPIGGTYVSFGAFDVDDAGRVWFRANVTGGSLFVPQFKAGKAGPSGPECAGTAPCPIPDL